jgi:hypothetical protein
MSIRLKADSNLINPITTISGTQYEPLNLNFNPKPLNIEIKTNTFNINNYNFDISIPAYGFSYNMAGSTPAIGIADGVYSSITPGINFLSAAPRGLGSTITNPPSIEVLTEFNLSDPSGFVTNFDPQNPPWKAGDTYSIAISIFSDGSKNVSVQFIRQGASSPTPINKDSVISNPTTTLSLSPSSTQTLDHIKVLVPIINIEGQTLLNSADIGDVIFTIQDKYQYYDSNPITCKKDNRCGLYEISPNKLKTTIFEKCSVPIASVVRGKGKNLNEKLMYLVSKLGEEEIGVPFIVFYPNMFLYAMLKYILCRLIYGEFSIKFLLRSFNDKFIQDLGNSRFCGAVPIFIGCVDNGGSQLCIYNYYKYFKC